MTNEEALTRCLHSSFGHSSLIRHSSFVIRHSRFPMSSLPILIPCLVIAITGFYYLFSSRGARHLTVIEPSPANTRRLLLRRINGAAMMLLAALLYLGLRVFDPAQ